MSDIVSDQIADEKIQNGDSIETSDSKVASPKSKEPDENMSENPDYELIDNVYYYSDTVSGIRYMYNQSKGEWVEASSATTGTIADHPDVTTDEEGRQYYWGEGMYLCRDPQGNIFYMDGNEWKPWSDKVSTDADTNRWYFCHKDDTFYRDTSTNKVYKLCKDTNQWEEYKKRKRKRRRVNEDEEFDTDDDEETDSSEEELEDQNIPPGSKSDPSISFDGKVYIKHDASDNMTYEWDPSKKAWFPKIDEDFMATYQLSYGFKPDGTKDDNPLKFDDDDEGDNDDDDNVKEDKVKTKKIDKKKSKDKDSKEEKPKPTWFEVEDAHNLKVYVSNLPTDMTEESFIEFMSKCGLVLKDPETQKFKVKLYNDSDGKFKGDALCSYIKIESVDLALQILDGYRLGDKTVKVERAKFTMKGEYDPKLKPRKRKKKTVEKLQKKQEKLFDWRPDPVRGQRMKHEVVVIFRNVFDPEEFVTSTERLLVHKEAIRSQAETFGPVKKVELFDRHLEGVVKVTFNEVESADMCAATLNNRLYLKRKLFVQTWDGAEKYDVEETEEQLKERLRKWNEFLEGKQS